MIYQIIFGAVFIWLGLFLLFAFARDVTRADDPPPFVEVSVLLLVLGIVLFVGTIIEAAIGWCGI